MGVRIFIPLPKPSPLARVRVFGRVGWGLRSGHLRVTLATVTARAHSSAKVGAKGADGQSR